MNEETQLPAEVQEQPAAEAPQAEQQPEVAAAGQPTGEPDQPAAGQSGETAAIAPEVAPAEQIAPNTSQAPAPSDGGAPAQRQTAYSTQTIVRGSEAAVKQSQQPSIAGMPGLFPHPETAPATSAPIAPVTDLKSAILQSLNRKSFFPISHILRRYFGARFATQEAAKEARVLLEQLHNSRQIIVNHNRHMQLARPFYNSATPMTQYHTLDKTPLEAMLGVGIAS